MESMQKELRLALHQQPVPSELRWQSGRLLTDRSLVRSQVVAITFLHFRVILFFATRTVYGKRPCGQMDKASVSGAED